MRALTSRCRLIRTYESEGFDPMALFRTVAAVTAMTAVVLSLAAASPLSAPVATLPSASPTDLDYPYLWPEEGTVQPRETRPGDTLLVSTNDGVVHQDDTVRSPAFTEPVTLHNAKTSYAAAATVRCDIQPGTYPVYLLGEHRDSAVWAKVRIQPGDRNAACEHPSPYTAEGLWPLLRPMEPVRPGGRAHIALGVNATAAVGDVITSPAFSARTALTEATPHTRREAEHPSLEQLTHSFTADVTVLCGTKPGLYPVHFGFGTDQGTSGGYRFEAQLRVLPDDDQSRSNCVR
ncbi:hypothetical protein [Streptomyces silvisoli]|uniref:Secreted protein n=1 Tax=Streptomyces silvisoli TaxID=3034235 RepID=A0ABT5ZTA6_9ACTN|nr:hypothetical protein [Streptomyces silvisoli]MDF3293060.1 hypothetical protein [Streptomyces silvisoli]